ncbi:hypothetical protein FGO68_gene11250 [Halteria grandinella]|uniref:Uncharacterized protein n=1 Tax=Halteria grandinella TaxID=5974 RepID=A0A8J8P2T2_HALGN|nr:hypothetical protein FGO68_gene11250 [Halteria grandinella]
MLEGFYESVTIKGEVKGGEGDLSIVQEVRGLGVDHAKVRWAHRDGAIAMVAIRGERGNLGGLADGAGKFGLPDELEVALALFNELRPADLIGHVVANVLDLT